ncbi:MAG: TlpA family protein disulfide reductase [Phycisphaerales bacterium]
MHPWTRTLVGAVAAALCVPAAAQAPDPAELMRAAIKALAAAERLSYDAHAEGVGAMAVQSPTISATVTLERSDTDASLAWKLRIDGASAPQGAGAPTKLAAAFDGAKFRSLREADKTVVEADAAHAPDLFGDGAGWVIGWLTRWDELVTGPFGPDEALAPARYDGRTSVHGVPCHVVYADYSDLSDPRLYGAWWFLAESDSLPRRVELHYLHEELGDGFARLTLSNLRVNDAARAESATFTLAVPDGYALKTYEPPVQAQKPSARARPPAPVQVGKPAPAFSLKDPSAKVHALADYKGKVVVLDFWATWCPPCRAAMPGVQRLHDGLKSRGVAVFGVNAWESGDSVSYMKDNNYTYGLLLDGDELAAAYGLDGIPAFAVIGVDGTLLHFSVGYDPQLEKTIEKLITEHLDRGGN